jgi:hypothetical protein
MPNVVKFLVLAMFSAVWLALHQRVMQLDPYQAYHIAADRRDRRKARFYFLSVWIGLIAAFLGLGCQEALSGVAFDSAAARDWTLGTVRGVGLWGLLIVSMVWSRVGLRASQPNSDGQSLTPLSEEEKNRK